MRRPLLLVAIVLTIVGLLAAKRRVREAENEAALWAEATEPLD